MDIGSTVEKGEGLDKNVFLIGIQGKNLIANGNGIIENEVALEKKK